MELRAEAVEKWYLRKNGEANRFFAVTKTDLSLAPGSLTVLMGRSGSGKTTLLHILAGLLKPDAGRVLAGETDLYALSDAALSRYRNGHIRLIPQGHTAVQSLSVLENILLPQTMYAEKGTDLAALRREAAEYMERFGIAHLADAYPKELSGGELRRLAVVRSLLGAREVILADEPTGDLDDENTRLVLQALRDAADRGATVLMATHEAEAAAYADALCRMDAGSLTWQ